jgi:hypothetical protein
VSHLIPGGLFPQMQLLQFSHYNHLKRSSKISNDSNTVFYYYILEKKEKKEERWMDNLFK